ncbi:MAG: SdpI family protein [Lachnospiraceae bacterium]|nr:SdpI family protein [Lachnospiraceae bacterium]
MFKTYKKDFIMTSLVVLLPVLAGILLWKRLPETIATHFGVGGEANGWSSKAFTVFGLPLFLLVCHMLCMVSTIADPKQKRIGRKMMRLIFWICPVVSVVCGITIYGNALGMPMNTEVFAEVLIGVIFLAVGNYLPKCRQNYTVGIKLPWTLSDEDNWNKTHRLSGKLFMLAGAVSLVNLFAGAPYLTFAAILAAVVLPILYSFSLYVRKTKQEK